MRGFARESVLAGLALILVITTYVALTPVSRDTKERAWQAQLRFAEHGLALAESLYYVEHHVYTTDLAALPVFDRDTSVAIHITRADVSGWSGNLELPWYGKRCHAEEPGPPKRNVDTGTRGRCRWQR